MSVRASTDGSNELVLVVQATDDDFDRAFVLVVGGGGDSIRGILRIRRSMLSVYIRIHVRRRRRWYFRRRHRVSTEHVLVRVLVRVLMNAFGVRKDSSFVALSCFVKIPQSKGLVILLAGRYACVCFITV